MVNFEVKKVLDDVMESNEMLLKHRGSTSVNVAFYGKSEEIEPLINDYFKEKDTKFITVDVSKTESKDFYFNGLKEIIKEDVPFVLYLKNYGIADPRLRYIWSSIYKDNSYVDRSGFVYTDKVKIITTIIIMDKSKKEYKELDPSENSCFWSYQI